MPRRLTLERLLSKLGIASRGQSAEWVRAGRVRVNNRLVRDPDTWVDWPADSVLVDGRSVEAVERRFFLFHKPCGYITTHSDERGRKTVFDLLPNDVFLHAVGRLDKATSGLLLVTNDSVLSSFLTEPTNKISRVYELSVWGLLEDGKISQAKAGVMDAGEHLKCDSVKVQRFSKRETHLEVALSQGKNREIRRLFKALGHEVTRLHRIQYGPFQLGSLALGEWQEISMAEAKRALGAGLQT